MSIATTLGPNPGAQESTRLGGLTHLKMVEDHYTLSTSSPYLALTMVISDAINAEKDLCFSRPRGHQAETKSLAVPCPGSSQ